MSRYLTKRCVVCGKNLEDSRNNNRRFWCEKHQNEKRGFFTVMNNHRKKFLDPYTQAVKIGFLQSKHTVVYYE